MPPYATNAPTQSFLDLPAELRLMVYRELAKDQIPMRVREQSSGPCTDPTVFIKNTREINLRSRLVATGSQELIFNSKRFMQSSGSCKGKDDLDLVLIAPILAACRFIRAEAMHEFTRAGQGHLYLSIRSSLPLDLMSVPHLKYIQHLTVDYSFISPGPTFSFDNDNWDLADVIEGELAGFLDCLVEICEHLCTFTLSITSDVCCNTVNHDSMHYILQERRRATIPRPVEAAVRKLASRVRDSFTLVTCGSTSLYPRLQYAIQEGPPFTTEATSLFFWILHPPWYTQIWRWLGMKPYSEQQAAASRINDAQWENLNRLSRTARDGYIMCDFAHITAQVWIVPTTKVPSKDLVSRWSSLTWLPRS